MDDEIVKSGDTVEVDYTGTFENGEVFDSSEDRDPLMFQVGSGQVIPGFDKAVIGMKVGDSKEVKIPPEEGYGTSGSHPLAGKTLIFKITVVGINPPE
jgi:peptidylprolyl isomerase